MMAFSCKIQEFFEIFFWFSLEIENPIEQKNSPKHLSEKREFLEREKLKEKNIQLAI